MQRRTSGFVATCVCLIAAVAAATSAGRREPIALVKGPHLLLDDYLIARSDGVERKVIQPQRFLDEPDRHRRSEHQNWQPFLTVLHDPAASAEQAVSHVVQRRCRRRPRRRRVVRRDGPPGIGRRHPLAGAVPAAELAHRRWPRPLWRERAGRWPAASGPPPSGTRCCTSTSGKFVGPRVAFSADGVEWTRARRRQADPPQDTTATTSGPPASIRFANATS